MNALASPLAQRNEPLLLHVPEVALTRLSLHLGRERAAGEVWDASLTYGISPEALATLVDHWCDDFDFRAAEARLNALPKHWLIWELLCRAREPTETKGAPVRSRWLTEEREALRVRAPWGMGQKAAAESAAVAFAKRYPRSGLLRWMKEPVK